MAILEVAHNTLGGFLQHRHVIDGSSHCRATQPSRRNNLYELNALLVQPHDLSATLVKLLQCLTPCTFFFLVSLIMNIRQISDLIGLRETLHNSPICVLGVSPD